MIGLYHLQMIERFAQMPSALRKQARWRRLDGRFGTIPVLLAHPDWDSGQLAPVVIWMHGRTVTKELDPGRYLRWIRAPAPGGGIAACAVDLPGHGERLNPESHTDQRAFDVVRQMADEIDDIVAGLAAMKNFDMNRTAIGGMSAGGMAALVRLCRPHNFACASVESTTGSWTHQRDQGMIRGRSEDEIAQLDPMRRLDRWREIPFQAIHSRLDKRVAFQGQAAFIEALRARYADPSIIEFIAFDQTGVPDEHSGFGVFASQAKDRQVEFFKRWMS
jgi:dienelactone hydrolase